MGMIARARSLWRALRWRSGSGPEMEEEFRIHMEMRAEDLIRSGLNPREAARRAQLEFGSTERYKEAGREARGLRLFDELQTDLRFAIRTLRKAPGFTAVAVVTLALGIGANGAVFGVMKSVLLDSLPYSESDRLIRVYGRYDSVQERGPLSPGMVNGIRERARSLQSAAAFSTSVPDVVVGGDDEARLASLSWVEPGLFRTLGVPAALGRTFRDDDATSDTARVVLLGHRAWHHLFAGDRSVMGREVLINGIPRTVIGVLPEGFTGPVGRADLYMAFDLDPSLRDPIGAWSNQWLGLVGRLERDIGPQSARREIAEIGAELVREHPDDNAGISLAAVPIRDALVGDTRTPLLVLTLSAAFVLLIACANLTGALLSRAISRRKEFAARVALGAGRGRIVRQLLTETIVLAAMGGIAGLLLAWLGLAAVRELALPALPDYADLSLDRGAVLVTGFLALGSALACGLAPAVSISRSEPRELLSDETRGGSESLGSRRLRGVLVAGQIALCISLLSGAGLLGRSLSAMANTPLGFDPDRVLTMSVQLPAHEYGSWQERLQFHQQLEERLRYLPGVLTVGSASDLPTTIGNRSTILIAGAPPPPEDMQQWVLTTSVSDDYFRTLRIPLLHGRTFDARDHNDVPPTVVISESMARRYWAEGTAVGSRIRMGPDPESPSIEVIGIVGDVRNDLSHAEAEPTAYRSNRQSTAARPSFVVRTERDPLALVPQVERELAAVDPGLPVSRITPLRALLADALAGRRLPVVLMAAFGVLALLLASVGVYAMFAHMAAARKREFGIRMALGSRPREIATLVLRQGAVWMIAGLISGGLGILLVVRILSGLLYGISRFDPIALGAAVLALLACATIALLTPIRRATRVDPLMALRAD